jgi:hypothetical protein
MNVSVVGVQPAGNQRRERSDNAVEFERSGIRCNSRAMLPHIQIEQHLDLRGGALRGLGQFAHRAGVVRHTKEAHAAKARNQSEESIEVWPHQRIRQQHVLRPGTRRHLRLGHGRAFELRDAVAELKPD